MGQMHNPYMAAFAPDTLDQLRNAREIDIETTRKTGEKARTTIWVVVDGEDVFVRSEYGDDGWWYRHLQARPDGVVHVRGRQAAPIAVRAAHADDPDSIERCSQAIRAKYGSGRSVDMMTRPEVLHATLRLEPA
jgi:hypothetical protein